jgi:predicted peptidase
MKAIKSMKSKPTSVTKISLAVLAFCLQIVLVQGTLEGTLEAAQAGRGGRGQQTVDPRVEQRTYLFEDTNEDLPYAVFVSSKVTSDRANPLVIALHGLGGNPLSLLRGNALDLAEDGGYILVGPMGYNPGGWYGSPVMNLGGRGGRGGNGGGNPENLAELSETDVMNVLAMIREEFNVDDDRTYLMGHSMGGAGAFFLGSKHTTEWAALAPIAPASFLMNDDRSTILQGIKDGGVPLLVVQGDADTLVPVANTRMWVDTMQELGLDYEYEEIPGADHGSVIGEGMENIFAFFGAH